MRYNNWWQEELLSKKVNTLCEGIYDNMAEITNCTLDISLKILVILIEDACLGQNYIPIELAHVQAKQIDSNWLYKYIS